MNVYLAIHEYFYDYEVIGVFATKQAAHGCIDKYKPARCIDTHKYHIEEYEVEGLAPDNNNQQEK